MSPETVDKSGTDLPVALCATGGGLNGDAALAIFIL
jgi:hypothetical protein